MSSQTAAVGAAEPAKEKVPTIEELAAQLASIQNAQAAQASQAAPAKPSHPHSAENWQSPGDIGLGSTLLIVAFVIGLVFLISYVGQRQGWFGKGKAAKYESLPRHASD